MNVILNNQSCFTTTHLKSSQFNEIHIEFEIEYQQDINKRNILIHMTHTYNKAIFTPSAAIPLLRDSFFMSDAHFKSKI